MEELRQQSKAVIYGKPIEREVFPHQIAFNVIPQVDSFLDFRLYEGGNEAAERSTANHACCQASRRRSPACGCPYFGLIRVAVSAEFQERVTLVEAREAILGFRGVELRDDTTDNVYPMPLDYAGEDVCAVGRLRIDSALENGLAFWVCGDQLLKGAALNAVQIAELL